MMKRFAGVLLALGICANASGGTGPKGEDPLARYLFPPEMVMGHAQEIGLDEAQRTAVRSEVRKAESRFIDLKFDLQTESEKMHRLLQEKPVDEAKVLAEVDKILALEKEIKKTQIGLLVRIKNQLSDSQQAKLSEIRAAEAR
jgi:Spy/CpxP family protein refolding chaperone